MNKTKIPIWTVSGGLHLDLARLWYQIKHQFIKQKMVLSGLLFSKRVHWVSRAVTDFWSRRGHEKKEVVEKHLNLTLPFYQQCSTTDSSQTNPFPNHGQKNIWIRSNKGRNQGFDNFYPQFHPETHHLGSLHHNLVNIRPKSEKFWHQNGLGKTRSFKR